MPDALLPPAGNYVVREFIDDDKMHRGYRQWRGLCSGRQQARRRWRKTPISLLKTLSPHLTTTAICLNLRAVHSILAGAAVLMLWGWKKWNRKDQISFWPNVDSSWILVNSVSLKDRKELITWYLTVQIIDVYSFCPNLVCLHVVI